MKSVLSLVQVLAVSTMVFGLLTGGFFGFSLYDLNWPIAQQLKDAVALDNNQMFQFIPYPRGSADNVRNDTQSREPNHPIRFKYAVGTLGWVILFLSIILAFIAPSILPMFGTVHMVILGIAALMIFLYNSPDKKHLCQLRTRILGYLQHGHRLLGDVLSYVRLFALGLSGGILASVVQQSWQPG